jgi:putative lipoprotein
MEQEDQYLAALESVATYKFDGITLNMRTAEGATAVNMQPVPTVSGLVTNVDNAAIPEGAILTVQIQDTSLQDVAATVIGEQIIENPGQFPIPYQVGYDPSDIASPQYTMSARITAADGTLLFINDTAIRVITNGVTEDVEIPVIEVGG